MRVYGTTNVRVVDASVFPILIAAHTQATVYAIVEKVRYRTEELSVTLRLLEGL